jgi:excisionase family DNA binding protein
MRKLTRVVTLPTSLNPGDADYARERYTTSQASVYLGVSREFLYRQIEQRRIGHLRDGRMVRLSQADLDTWRQNRRVEIAAVGPGPLPKSPRHDETNRRVARARELAAVVGSTEESPFH